MQEKNGPVNVIMIYFLKWFIFSFPFLYLCHEFACSFFGLSFILL